MKSLPGPLLVFSLVLSSLAMGPVTAAGATASLMGDVDGDGRVGVKDVLTTIKIAVGLQPATPVQQFLGDVAPRPGKTRPVGDGAVNVLDAVAILKVAAGLTGTDTLGNDQTQVLLSPRTAFVAPGGSFQFDLVAVGPSAGAPVWTVVEGPAGGSITQEGLYTAPPASALATVRVTYGGLLVDSLVVVDDPTPPPPPPG